jgi:hypothetical protein
VEEHQAEIENAAGDALAVHQHMFLVQMPAARPNLQGGDFIVQLVFLAGFVDKAELAADGVFQIHLALNLVKPVGAVGILEVGHIGISAGVVGVDDHLGFDRAGDFGAAALQRFRQRRDFPVAFADVLGFRQKIGHFAGIDAGLALDALFQQFLTARFKRPVQLGDQASASWRQNFIETGMNRGVDLHASRQIEAHGGSFRGRFWISKASGNYFNGFQWQKPGGILRVSA